MHGSEGGRWKRGDEEITDRYPWAPARKGGNRAAGCKSYHPIFPPPRQRPTLPASAPLAIETPLERGTPTMDRHPFLSVPVP